jgi:hypothetical protein
METQNENKKPVGRPLRLDGGTPSERQKEYYKTYVAKTKPYTCVCGKMVKLITRTQHERSHFHQNHIRSLRFCSITEDV